MYSMNTVNRAKMLCGTKSSDDLLLKVRQLFNRLQKYRYLSLPPPPPPWCLVKLWIKEDWIEYATVNVVTHKRESDKHVPVSAEIAVLQRPILP